MTSSRGQRAAPAPSHAAHARQLSWLRPALLLLSYNASLHVPRAVLPWPWLLAMAVPALVLGLVSTRVAARYGPWRVFVLGVLLQASAIGLAVQNGPPLGVVALLCVLLIPMCFWTSARGRAKDVTTVLALSFCLLLTGVLLRDSWSHALLGIYAANAALVLLLERESRITSGARVRVHAARASAWSFVSRSFTLCLALASAALAMTLVLTEHARELPASAPLGDSERELQKRRGPRKTVGVDERFFLESMGAGSSLRHQKQALCFVESVDGDVLPLDLYLRCAAFETAERREWTRAITAKRRARFHRLPRANSRTRHARVRVLEALDGLVPVVPGLVELAAQRDVELEADPVLVRLEAPGVITCEQRFAAYLPCPETRVPGRPSLLALPRHLLRPELQRLADTLPTGAPLDETLEAVAALLARRCRYVLNDPEGPYDDALLNFLFAARRGYCMHFAGAAVLLLRSVGVPCRVASGLFRGEVDSDAAELEAEAPAAWRRAWTSDPARRRAFGSQHAHSWVELPRADGSWFVFDPTPAPHRGLERARARATEEALAKADEEEGGGAGIPTSWLVAGLVLLLLVSRLALWRRVERPARAAAHALAKTPAHGHFERMLELLARSGLERARGESWLAYAARLARSPRVTAPEAEAFRSACRRYCALRYGAAPLDPAGEAVLLAGVERARELGARERATQTS